MTGDLRPHLCKNRKGWATRRQGLLHKKVVGFEYTDVIESEVSRFSELRARSGLAEQCSLTHNANVSVEEKAVPADVLRRVIWIQTLTLIWMGVEAVVSLGAAWIARSPALLAFGGDSAVELFSAAIVFRRFYSPSHGEDAEGRAGRIAGSLLFILAAFVLTASVLTLLGHVEAQPSPVGIALLVLAAVFMPWLAAQKRQLSIRTASAALRADAAESAVCGYLALIALVGLVVNALWKVSWADPVASLGLLPLIVHEGWQARKGKPCCR